MKKPLFTALMLIAVLSLGFTLGLWIGRNYFRTPVQVSILEETSAVPQTAASGTVSETLAHDSGFPIDINRADLLQLTALPGIGEGLAERIILYRDSIGGFRHIEELINVAGIGEKRLEAILDLITVGGTQ